LQDDVEKPKFFQDEFKLRIYDKDELKDMLLKIGFKKINFFDTNGEKFIKNKTINMLIVAEK
jgi:hypothetical protein